MIFTILSSRATGTVRADSMVGIILDGSIYWLRSGKATPKILETLILDWIRTSKVLRLQGIRVTGLVVWDESGPTRVTDAVAEKDLFNEG